MNTDLFTNNCNLTSSCCFLGCPWLQPLLHFQYRTSEYPLQILCCYNNRILSTVSILLQHFRWFLSISALPSDANFVVKVGSTPRSTSSSSPTIRATGCTQLIQSRWHNLPQVMSSHYYQLKVVFGKLLAQDMACSMEKESTLLRTLLVLNTLWVHALSAN